MQLQQRAESMRASVHAASTRRLLRSAFKTFFYFAAASRQSTERSETDDMVKRMYARRFLCKAFKFWTMVFQDNRLQALQQVTACIIHCCFCTLTRHSGRSELMPAKFKVPGSFFVSFVDGMTPGAHLGAKVPNCVTKMMTRSKRNNRNVLNHLYTESM